MTSPQGCVLSCFAVESLAGLCWAVVLLRVCVLGTLSWGHGDGSSWVKGLGSHLCNWESHSKPKGNKRQKTSEHLPLFQGVLDVFVSPIAHTEISRLLLMESPIPILWKSVGVFVHVSGLWISPRKTGFINTLQIKHCFKLVSVMPHKETLDNHLLVGAPGSPEAVTWPEFPDRIATPEPQ